MNSHLDLIVATATRLLRVQTDGGKNSTDVEVLHENCGFYYGVTYNSDSLFALCRNNWNDGRCNEIIRFDSGLTVVDEIAVPEVEEGHQAMVWGNQLFVCNTNRNCVSIVSLSVGGVEQFYPLPERRDKNYNHLNSIVVDEHRFILGFANRFRDSFQLHFDRHSRSLLRADSLGLAAHNVVEWNGGTLICSSLNGSLMFWRDGVDGGGHEHPLFRIALLPDEESIDLTTINIKRLALRHYHGGTCYPRGLAVSGNAAIVGLSEFSKRSSRKDSASRVMIILNLPDVLSGERADCRVLELGRCGAVCEVRLLNLPDDGHPVPTEASRFRVCNGEPVAGMPGAANRCEYRVGPMGLQ